MTRAGRIRAALALTTRLCRVAVTTGRPRSSAEPGPEARNGASPDISLVKVTIVLGRR